MCCIPLILTILRIDRSPQACTLQERDRIWLTRVRAFSALTCSHTVHRSIQICVSSKWYREHWKWYDRCFLDMAGSNSSTKELYYKLRERARCVGGVFEFARGCDLWFCGCGCGCVKRVVGTETHIHRVYYEQQEELRCLFLRINSIGAFLACWC